jgi:hypothetical protein
MTWVYNEIYLNTSNPDIFQTVLNWDDNPWLTAEQKEQMARGLSEEALRVRREGSFVQRTGQVCNWWQRDVHLVPDMTRQSSWNIYRVVDFGWSSSKTCVLWMGVDANERVFVFDGLYVNETTDEELAKLIKSRESNFRVTRGWADNTPDRIQGLARHGVMCEPVKKSTGGEKDWDTVKTEAMARIGRIDPVSGKSRLAISTTLTYVKAGSTVNWFVEEAETLRWKDKRMGSGMRTTTSEWDKESGPKDSHYDAMDTFAYFAVMYERSNRSFKNRGGSDIEYEENGMRPTPVDKKKKSKSNILNRLTGY